MKLLSLARLVLLLSGLSLLFLNSSPFAHAAPQHVYVSAGGFVTVYAIAESGELEKRQALELAGAGPIGVAPDGRTLYIRCTNRPETTGKAPGIATTKIRPDGSLELVKTAGSRISAGYLSVDDTGSYLAGNNYGAGKVALWKLEGGVFRGEVARIMELEKRAHSAVFSPANRYLFVPATGPNKVFQLRFDAAAGTIRPNDPAFAEGPTGETEARQPRHLIFHPRLDIAYTTNERLQPGVGVWEFDPETGTLRTVQNIVTQPEGFEGMITTADLHLTPDARFLYVSNRDVTDRNATTGEDSIVAFSVDAKTGRLEQIGHQPCAHVPRSFDVDETGRFLYVGGQGDGRLEAFTIDPQSGRLSRIATYEAAGGPSWVTCLDAPGMEN